MALELSQYQKDIIKFYKENPSTNMQVNALAGSGKSFILKQLSDLSTKSDIYMAFNNTVAKEMETKITNPKVKIKTFHALAYSFMMYNMENSGGRNGIGKQRNTNNKPVLDNLKPYKILEKFFENRKWEDFDEKFWLTENYVKLYNLVRLTRCQVNGLSIARLVRDHNLFADYEFGFAPPSPDQAADMIIKLDNASLSEFELHNTIDYTDMLYITFLKISNNEWSVPYWGFYTNIYIDESQDMSMLQLCFLKFIKRKGGRYVFVGDKNQSAYLFAGAGAHSFNSIKKMYAPIEEFDLPICYRCPTSHLDKVNKEFHIPIKPRPDAPKGSIKHIAKEDIVKYVKVGDLIIARKNKWLTDVILSLASNGIPIFMQDKELVDNILKMVDKKKSGTAQGVYDKLTESKNKYQKQMMDTIRQAHDADGNQINQMVDTNTKIDQIEFVLKITQTYLKNNPYALKTDLIRYLTKLLNTTDIHDCVRITSVHKAKGLEADHVFVLNEGKICKDFRHSPEQAEQEVNLSYISLTRSKDVMYLVAEEEDSLCAK